MMRFLTDRDYLKQIQEKNLLEVIEDDYNLLYETERLAEAEIRSKLVQRYDMDKVFVSTQVFDINNTYYGKNLILYTETCFDMIEDYNINDRVSFDGKIYKCISNTTISGINPKYSPDWQFITNDNSLYFAKTNQPEWNVSTNYIVGSIVWYNNYVYTAKENNIAIQPSNLNYWIQGAQYSFTNFTPEDTNYWIKGDNRNAQIVAAYIDITLYHVHTRLNPINIPQLRKERYDGDDKNQNGGAIGWLKRVNSGVDTAELPALLPEQGLSIMAGSEIKNNNSY